MVDKPSGMTSHDVVNIARRSLGTRSIGHTGTLDKPATGLMVLLVGRATKLSPFLLNLDKKYEGTIVFGLRTTTDDDSGEIIETLDCPGIDADTLRNILDKYVGPLRQKIPKYSAVQVDGKKLYKLAVNNVEFEQPVRDIFIFKSELLDLRPGDHPEARVFFHCSKGTYIRALARDIGDDAGCGGHLKELRRTSIGSMNISGSITLQALKEEEREALYEKVWPMERAVADFPALVLRKDMETVVQSGKKLTADIFAGQVEAKKGQVLTILNDAGELIALVEAKETLDRLSGELSLKYLRVIKVPA